MPSTFQQGQWAPGYKADGAPQLFGGPITTGGGIVAGGNKPTVAILAGAGTVGSITKQVGTDQAGSFVLTAGTASINGGSLASVTFATPLPAAPAAVTVNAGFTTGTLSFGVGAVSLSTTGFVIQGGAPTSGAAYLMSYQVIRQY